MTSRNWCPTCSESCTDHPKVCTVCGEALVQAPAPTSLTGSSATVGAGGQRQLSDAAMAENILRVAAASVGATGNGINNAQAAALRAALAAEAERGEGGWEEPSPEAMDPQAARHSRPTSLECIDKIPRILVDKRSAVLHEATVHCVPPPPQGTGAVDPGVSGSLLRREALVLVAAVGELGTEPPFELSGRLVMAHPLTGKGGELSFDSRASLNNGGVAYMERGGGVTFAAKALMAQRAGAKAVVVGNNVGVWPYVMKDSTGEGVKKGLNIPVLMVKRSDGAHLKKIAQEGGTVRCTIEAKQAGKDCVVCRETFAVGDTVMRLPFCAHCFHENCALSWLKRHNTCPYCRRELPTDDAVYEAERRRVSRTHAAGHTEESNEQWESLFG